MQAPKLLKIYPTLSTYSFQTLLFSFYSYIHIPISFFLHFKIHTSISILLYSYMFLYGYLYFSIWVYVDLLICLYGEPNRSLLIYIQILSLILSMSLLLSSVFSIWVMSAGYLYYSLWYYLLY